MQTKKHGKGRKHIQMWDREKMQVHRRKMKALQAFY